MVLETAVMCLAMNVYHEARSENLVGQYAVALVTMNRARWKATNVCDEVFKPQQFSWANGKVQRNKRSFTVDHSMKPREMEAWVRSYRVAQEVLAGRIGDFTGGSDHYHTIAVKPAWRLGLSKVVQIGSHIFYRRS
jgi:N-acetylmuramoyl-L-alanine amidase